ncbi:hypothetical protein LXL04_031080 [Taraxacum kok-saghyz]
MTIKSMWGKCFVLFTYNWKGDYKLYLLHPPVSYCGSRNDDIPSTSYTPPSERYDFPDETKLKIVNCVPVHLPSSDGNTNPAPRVSFSFPVPRISFAKGSVSPANAKLRSYDIYIGYHGQSHGYGQNPNLVRFCKWLKSELEVQGIACFVADRAKYADSQSHEIADRVICSVTFGIVVVTRDSLSNYLSLEEIRFFAQKKNLIPLFFDMDANEVTNVLASSDSKECKDAIDGLMKSHEFKLEANDGNWRCCVSKTAGILKGKLGRMSVAEKEIETGDEIPYPKNRFFVGREKEITEIETVFFYARMKTKVPHTFEHLEHQKDLLTGLDVTADEEKERGRIRSFDEQETEAFKKGKT